MKGGRSLRLAAPLALALAALGLLAASASATQLQRPFLETFGSAEQPSFPDPSSLAVDPAGNVLIGVEGEAERQRLTVSATAGTFKLSLEGKATDDIAFDAGASTVKQALEATLGFKITVNGRRSGSESHYGIEFTGTLYSDLEQLVCEDGGTPLSGGSGCSVETTADGVSPTLQRFHGDGTPAPFSVLGTNVLDGRGNGNGPGSTGIHPCASPQIEECDETPQNGLDLSPLGNLSHSPQISVDPVDGDIYVVQTNQDLVDIFSAGGEYLGQLTQAGSSFRAPCGVVVDSTGTVYVAQNKKISVFVPSGNLPVNADNTANIRLSGMGSGNFCRMALGSGPSEGSIFISNNGNIGKSAGRVLKVDPATEAVSVFAEGYEELVAVDPTSGNLLAYNRADQNGNPFAEMAEFDGSQQTATEAPLSRLVVETLNIGHIVDVAIDASGRAYILPAILSTSPEPYNVLVYGQPAVVPTVDSNPAAEVTSTGATLSGTVSPEGIAVTECFFEWGPTLPDGRPIWADSTPCNEAIPPDSASHPVEARISDLFPNGVKYAFRLAVRSATGTERSVTRSFVTGSSAETKPATVTGLSTATLHGVAHPEGSQYEQCFFEWGLASTTAFEHTVPCSPAAGEIPPDNGSHPVSADVSGLEEGTLYRFRLRAKSAAGAQIGPELRFETFGRPAIEAVRASYATRDTAILEAEINPRGFPASYRFEWGPTASYGNLSSLIFQPVGSGTSPVRVTAQISSLSPGATYHYRVVASGGAGTVRSADQKLQTLNACGLPDGRCLELVSPREPGVALPLENIAGLQLLYQAADSPGALAYEAELGFPGATYGGETVYVGTRGPSGWSTSQYNPSLAGTGQGSSVRYKLHGLSPNLDCGVVSSSLPLVSGPAAKPVVEGGGWNLYRRNADGSYTLITDLPATRKSTDFTLAGLSRDCSHVVFSTAQEYPGIPGVGTIRLYEWDGGQLRNVGWVPSSGGEVVAEASAGLGRNTYNAVSEDGTRVFFTATSKSGNDSGNQALFVRIDGEETLNVSQSPLAQNTGASFQGATPDGSRVYFIANAGLTAESSSAGRDLYECHIVTGASGPECVLTDLSVNPEPGGVAEVGASTGFQFGALVGMADDGSRVYFLAQGQLVPGQGRTLTENENADSYSLYVYEAASGGVKYVGDVSGGASEISQVVATGQMEQYTSRVSPDGRYLLFESRQDLTSYRAGGAQMAYLYDAAGAGSLTCVSCRQDGKPTFNAEKGSRSKTTRLLAQAGPTNPNYQPQSLVVREGRPVVIFRSLDALAAGGVDGEWGLYEWAHGQVFNIAPDLPGAAPENGDAGTLTFLGASREGTDLYFVDSAPLNWENADARRSVWDARVGGGFAQPPTPSKCNPQDEGSCQGPAVGTPGAPPVGSTTFNGPGNVKPTEQRKHHKRHSKHRRKKSGKKKAKKGPNKRGKKAHNKKGKKKAHHKKGQRKRAHSKKGQTIRKSRKQARRTNQSARHPSEGRRAGK